MKIAPKFIYIILFYLFSNVSSFAVEIEINADEVVQDAKNKKIEAKGKVVVKLIGDEKKTVLADKLVYHTESKIISALGNVILISGENKVHGHEMRLEDDFAKAIIEFFTTQLKDGGVLSAKKASKKGKLTHLRKATYSSCGNMCKKTPRTWSFFSYSSKIDEENEVITHSNVFFRIYDMPVFYLPYFSHPTAKAKSKTGFLTPKYSSSDYGGFEVSLPFYWNIDKNRELLLKPRIMSKISTPLIETQYNHLFANGDLKLAGSFTKDGDFTDFSGQRHKDSKLRGHLIGSFDHGINNNWHFGTNIRKTTDLTYMKKFDFDNKSEFLISNLYFNYANGPNFGVIKTYGFQNLRLNDNFEKNATALPAIEYHHEFPLWNFNNSAIFKPGHFDLDIDASAVNFNKDHDHINRFSTAINYNQPLKIGRESFNLRLTSFSDFYDLQGKFKGLDKTDNKFDGTFSKITPELEISWKKHLLTMVVKSPILIEPVIKLLSSKEIGVASKDLPNRDSLASELTASNVFFANRFTGFDRREVGTRANLGVKGRINNVGDGSVGFVLGKIYYFTDPGQALLIKGVQKGFSDLVGHVNYDIEDYGVYNNFRIGKGSGKKTELQNNEIGVVWKNINLSKDLKIGYDVSYIFQRDNAFFERGKSHEIKLAANLKYGQNITFNSFIRRDLGGLAKKKGQNRNIELGGGIRYNADCVTVDFSAKKDYTIDLDRNLGPVTKFKVELFLKNIN